MRFRIATFNLERNEKRWRERRELILQQLAALRPEILSLNEIWLPETTGRWVCEHAREEMRVPYTLLEQRRAAEPAHPEAEGLLTTFPVIEQSHRFFSGRDTVAFVARLEIPNQLQKQVIDIYVTHLYPDRYPESRRVNQVEELLAWIKTRDDVKYKIVCGDCNAPLGAQSMRLLAGRFRPTQIQPTAFTPLREAAGEPTHPEWERFDRCIDFIWVSESLRSERSDLCFDRPCAADPTLWPSDHVGVWADLELG